MELQGAGKLDQAAIEEYARVWSTAAETKREFIKAIIDDVVPRGSGWYRAATTWAER